MSKDDQMILTFRRDDLFTNSSRTGFIDYGELKEGFTGLHSEFRRRGDMENDPTYKQIIPYIILRSTDPATIGVYTRGVKGEEGRLHNLLSCGFGGHIEKEDIKDSWANGKINAFNIACHAAKRELEEELKLPDAGELVLNFIGFVNNDEDEVGSVHFGVVFTVYVDNHTAAMIERKCDSIQDLRFITMDACRECIDDFEPWSVLCLEKLLHSQEKASN